MDNLDEIVIPDIEDKPNKKRKLAVGIAAVCVVAALVVIVVAAKLYFNENRALMKGLQNLAAEIQTRQELTAQNGSAVHADTSFNVSAENLPVTLGIDTQIQRDADARQLRASTAVSVMNMKLANAELYGEDETLAVAVPTLWDENFVFDTKQIVKQYNDSLLARKWGRIDGIPEISLDLFAERESLVWQELVAHCQEILKELEIERIEEKIAVSIPEKDNKQYRCSQYRVVMPTAEVIGAEWNVLDEDMRLLLSVDENDRIVQIMLEEPLLLSVGELTGSVSFVGEERSIDDILVNVQIKGRAEMNAECVFQENDTSVIINLDKLTVSVEDLGELQASGSVTLESLEEKIEPLTGESIRIFEITEEEYDALGQQMMKNLLWKTSIAGKLFG